MASCSAPLLCRTSEARGQQMQRELHECERAKAALQGRVRQLQEHLLVATDQVGQLQAQAGQLQAQLEQTRQRQIAHAEASGAREQELLEQLADCDAALRQRDDQLQACTAALTKYQEADKRRSSGGSHPRAEPQQQQPQQQEQQPAQAEAPPAEGAVAAGGAAPAAAGDPPSLGEAVMNAVPDNRLWDAQAQQG